VLERRAQRWPALTQAPDGMAVRLGASTRTKVCVYHALVYTNNLILTFITRTLTPSPQLTPGDLAPGD